MAEQQLASKVWNWRSFGGSTPGLLLFDEGQVSFTTEAGEEFHVPVNELKEVKWPFLQFGLGFSATVNGQKYKFTFMKPAGAADFDDSALTALAKLTRISRSLDAISSLSKWGNNKKTAKEWKALLAK